MPAQPKHPVVPLDIWRPAFETICAFRAQAPWDWLFDSDVCVLVDPAGGPWFAAVLGMAGTVRGVAFYRGGAGLRALHLAMGDPAEAETQDVGFGMDALTVWFGARNELPAAQRELYAKLGFKPARGTRWAWPAVFDHRPGYVAWGPTAEQVAWLAMALPAVMRFAALVRSEPRLLADRSRGEYPQVPLDGTALRAEELEWRHWRADEEPVDPALLRLDDETEAALRALPMGAGHTLDLGWFYLPGGIAEGDRPYHGRVVAALEPETAICLTMKLLAIHEDLAEKAAVALAEQFRRGGARPAKVRVQNADLGRRLQPWLEQLGCRVETGDRLESVSVFRHLTVQFMGG